MIVHQMSENTSASLDRAKSASVIIPWIVGLALFMQMLDSTIVITALPSMAQSLAQSPARLNFVVTAYLIGVAVCLPTSGWIADRFGTRKVFVGAIGVFVVSSGWCGAASTLPELVAARFLQGMGGAMMVPIGRLIMVKALPQDTLVRAMAIAGAPGILGSLLGPPAGGFIVTYVSWRWIFLINLPLGFVIIALALFLMRDLREQAVPPFDLRGFVLTGVGLSSLVVGLEMISRGGEFGYIGIAVSGLSAMCWIAFARHSRLTASPLLDLSLLHLRTFATATLGSIVCRVAVGGTPFLLALLLQVGFGFSPFEAGSLIFASAAGSLVSKPLLQPITRRLGFRTTLLITTPANSLLLYWYSLMTVQTPHWLIVIGFGVGGFLLSVLFTCIDTLVYTEVPAARAAQATALASTILQISLSLGVTTAALLLNGVLLLHRRADVSASDVSNVLMILAILPLLAVPAFAKLHGSSSSSLTGERRK